MAEPSLKEKLNNAVTDAMRNKDKTRLVTLRMAQAGALACQARTSIRPRADTVGPDIRAEAYSQSMGQGDRSALAGRVSLALTAGRG